ncbi:MAG: hypothetical protein ABH950_09010 [Candidatus Altiarchaeota archaeon]
MYSNEQQLFLGAIIIIFLIVGFTLATNPKEQEITTSQSTSTTPILKKTTSTINPPTSTINPPQKTNETKISVTSENQLPTKTSYTTSSTTSSSPSSTLTPTTTISKYSGLGYRKAKMKIIFICPSCAPAVVRTLKNEPGVVSLNMAYKQKINYVIYDPSKVSLERIFQLSTANGEGELILDEEI